MLYLKGISTGDFAQALEAILGPNAVGLSATNIVQLKEGWQKEYQAWSGRDLSGTRYVYWWTDGIYPPSQRNVAALRRRIRGEVAQGGRLLNQRPRRFVCLLRFPGRPRIKSGAICERQIRSNRRSPRFVTERARPRDVGHGWPR